MYDRFRESGPAAIRGHEIRPADSERPVYRWYMLALLLLIYILGAVDRSVVSVVAEPLKHEFHLTDAQIGGLGGLAYSVTFAVFVLPVGWLVDRVDRRALLSLTVTIWSLLTLLGAIASNFTYLVLARMGVGAAESGASPTSLSLVTDIFPLRQRNTAVSVYYAGAPAGQLVIFIVGGWLLVHFGWRTVFLVASIPGLVLAALLFFTGEEPVRGSQDLPANRTAKGAVPGNAPSLANALRLIVRDPSLRNAMIGNMVSTGVGSTLVIWLTSFLVRVHGLSVSRAAIWVGVAYGLSMTVASLIVGPIADWYSKGDPRRLARIPALMTFLAIFAGTAMTLAPTIDTTLAALVVFALLSGLFNGPGYALVLSLSRPEMRGSTMATAKLLVILIGSGLFPVLTGAISDAVGGTRSIRPAVLVTVWLLGIASVYFILAGRNAGRG
jgi:MFS family permease